MELRFRFIYIVAIGCLLSVLVVRIESHQQSPYSECFVECLSKLREPGSHDSNSVGPCNCGACIEPLVEKRTIDNKYECSFAEKSQGKKKKKADAQKIDNNVEDINKEVLPDVLEDRYIENIINNEKQSNKEPQDNTANNVEPTTSTTHKPETHQPAVHRKASDNAKGKHGVENVNSITFLFIVIGCSTAGVIGLILAGVCWYKIHKRAKESSEVDYPAYGVTGPNKVRSVSPGDRKLAESAQMYHYQHQKQQMIALERANSEKNEGDSDGDTDDENEEDHITVYECPGLAPTGEMEVRNPLFNEDLTPTPGEKTIKN